MEHTCASSVTTNVLHSVYNKGYYGEGGFFFKFIDHVKTENPNIALSTIFCTKVWPKKYVRTREESYGKSPT